MFFRRCADKKKISDVAAQESKNKSPTLSILDAQSCARLAVTSKKNYDILFRYIGNEKNFIVTPKVFAKNRYRVILKWERLQLSVGIMPNIYWLTRK